MSLKRRAWLLLAATITLQLVVIRSSHSLKHIDHPRATHLLRRGTSSSSSSSSPPTTSLLDLPYTDWYDAHPNSRPWIILLIVTVLGFLFSFIGISASDFFCPNLATIAAYLGLNESTAGVTFLAFGNGSPDVFSTFAALKGGTFSLAIGELIGAATFIISIIVGTIALIKPFHVPRTAFLRDVIFFTLAVVLVVTVLHDGHVYLKESGSMVLLYLAYVAVIVGGNWWSKRQNDKETAKALGWTTDSYPAGNQNDGHVRDVESTPLNRPGHNRQVSSRSFAPSFQLSEPDSPNDSRGRSRPSSPLHPSGSNSPILSPSRAPLRRHHSHFSPRPHDPEMSTPRANFSLLGAIEFRDVVNSLKRESESRGSSPPRTPQNHERGDYFGQAVTAAFGHRRSSSAAIHGNGHLGRQPSVRGRQRSVSNVGPSNLNSFSLTLDLPPVATPEALSPSTPSSEITVRPAVSEPNPWRDQLGKPPSGVRTPELLGLPSTRNGRIERPRIDIPGRTRMSASKIPSISVTDPSGLPGAPSPEEPSTPAPQTESRFRIRRRTRKTLRVLFPSLQSFRHKSYLGMILAITSVPALLALTLTLPVVDDGPRDEGAVALPDGEYDGLHAADLDHVDRTGDDAAEEGDHLLGPNVGEELHHLVEGGFSPLHSPLGRINHHMYHRSASYASSASGSEGDGEEMDDLNKEILEETREVEGMEFYPVLTAAQCILGPSFVSYIVFGDAPYLKWILIAAICGGAIAAAAVMMYASDGTSRPWRLVRCFAGFICAMVWIAAIADQVVNVLQALGEILGLSDAIIGLTIFAVGNSLADLVANVTVAQFAPAMAYAACFGGPMLNLLLGVGGSGTYHMLTSQTHTPVHLHFSPTLWVSASGLVLMLVTTAIVVPLNGYLIDRRWACCLIVGYIILMSINVAVEVKTGRG